jgi:hypothetical protein
VSDGVPKETSMGKTKEYALNTVLNTSYEEAVSKVTEALKGDHNTGDTGNGMVVVR